MESVSSGSRFDPLGRSGDVTPTPRPWALESPSYPFRTRYTEVSRVHGKREILSKDSRRVYGSPVRPRTGPVVYRQVLRGSRSPPYLTVHRASLPSPVRTGTPVPTKTYFPLGPPRSSQRESRPGPLGKRTYTRSPPDSKRSFLWHQNRSGPWTVLVSKTPSLRESFAHSLRGPFWNSQRLDRVYPKVTLSIGVTSGTCDTKNVR